jgi:hypothetical protein
VGEKMSANDEQGEFQRSLWGVLFQLPATLYMFWAGADRMGYFALPYAPPYLVSVAAVAAAFLAGWLLDRSIDARRRRLLEEVSVERAALAAARTVITPQRIEPEVLRIPSLPRLPETAPMTPAPPTPMRPAPPAPVSRDVPPFGAGAAYMEELRRENVIGRQRDAVRHPVLAEEAQKELSPITLTFDLLRELPPLYKKYVQASLDLVPERDVTTIPNRDHPDAYHVRDDGELIDLRLSLA